MMVRNFAIALILIACCQVTGFSQTIGPSPPPTPTDPEINLRVDFKDLNPFVNNTSSTTIIAEGDVVSLKNIVWVWSRMIHLDIKVRRFYKRPNGQVTHLPDIVRTVLNGWLQIPSTTAVTVAEGQMGTYTLTTVVEIRDENGILVAAPWKQVKFRPLGEVVPVDDPPISSGPFYEE